MNTRRKNHVNRNKNGINSSNLRLQKKVIVGTKTNFQNESTGLKPQSNLEIPDTSLNQNLRTDHNQKILKRSSRISPKISQERQITEMLISISFTFLFLTLPFSIHELLRKLYPNQKIFQNRFTQIRLVLFLLDCLHATYFILYCLIGKKFRNELKNILLSK